MKNILIVDDSKLVMKALLARTLSGKKLRPVLAKNFEQAQSAVESGEEFFVAIADLILLIVTRQSLLNICLKRIYLRSFSAVR